MKVLFAGKKVAEAFGLRKPEYLRWIEHEGRTVAIVPHPSGINRWYNDRKNRARMRRFMRKLLFGCKDLLTNEQIKKGFKFHGAECSRSVSRKRNAAIFLHRKERR